MTFADLAATATIPRIRINIARRIADSEQSTEGFEALAQHLSRPIDDMVCENLLTGILQGVEGKRKLSMPSSWRPAFDRLSTSRNTNVQEQVIRLAVVFKDQEALTTLRKVANNSAKPASDRVRAVEALVGQRTAGFDNDLILLLKDDAVRSAALKGLASYQSAQTAPAILAVYSQLKASERQDAQLTLASRKSWARALIDAVESKQIQAKDLTAYSVRQIRSLQDKKLNEKLGSYWGDVRATAKDKAKKISSIKRWLSTEKLDQADMVQGARLYKTHCASCHRLFGEGGAIGPDITGAQRHNLDYMLENIVDPSAAVAKDYQMETVVLVSGRVVTGLIASETDAALTIQTVNERIVLPLNDVEERSKSKSSIMPDGLFRLMSENNIRDLLGYLKNKN